MKIVAKNVNVRKNQISDNFPSGVSIESASYMENNNLDENESDPIIQK